MENNKSITCTEEEMLELARGTMYLTPEKKGAIKHFLYDNATVYLKRKLDSLNTEITYALRNKVVSIVEHRVE